MFSFLFFIITKNNIK